MKTDCGRVYALRCTALPDAEAGRDFHLSVCGALPELVGRPPDRESRIWRRRVQRPNQKQDDRFLRSLPLAQKIGLDRYDAKPT